MGEIIVCVGSSCHIKGSHAVIEQYQHLIRQYGLQGRMTLKASFCQQACTRGITVTFRGKTIDHLTPETAGDAFVRELADLITTPEARP